jgi:hypothetical protein
MKLAFFCSSLESGRDGVGDYTRRLAIACAARGHRVLLFALNDRHITVPTEECISDLCFIFRWPARQPWAEREADILRKLANFSPDWVSWQMVSYGYNSKGIIGEEILSFARQLRSYRLHVMMHEIWIGLAENDSWQDRMVGWTQCRAICAFLEAAAPARLHTSTPVYAAALAHQGWNAALLPIFSNIPVEQTTEQERRKLIERRFPNLISNNGHQPFIAVTFGTLHPQWESSPTIQFLKETAARGRHCILLAIGRTGAQGEAILSRVTAAGLPASATGELPPATVSALLQSADVGIALHPWNLIGKSGATAAMLDHGLPVLVPRDDWKLRRGTTPSLNGHLDPRLARLDDLTLEKTGAWLNTPRTTTSSLEVTAELFLDSISHP